MKITLEPTDSIMNLSPTISARVWRGETESGIPLVAYIAVVSPTIGHDDPRMQEFDTELRRVAGTPELVEHRRSLDPPPAQGFDARHFIDFDDEDEWDDGDVDEYDDHPGEDW